MFGVGSIAFCLLLEGALNFRLTAVGLTVSLVALSAYIAAGGSTGNSSFCPTPVNTSSPFTGLGDSEEE